MRRSLLAIGGALALVAVSATPVLAGTGGTEFDTVYTTISGWATGTLGKLLALAAVLVGLGIGIVRQSVVGFVVGLGMAIGIYQAPTVVGAIVTATLPVASLGVPL